MKPSIGPVKLIIEHSENHNKFSLPYNCKNEIGSQFGQLKFEVQGWLEDTQRRSYSQDKRFRNVTLRLGRLHIRWITGQTVYPLPERVSSQEFQISMRKVPV